MIEISEPLWMGMDDFLMHSEYRVTKQFAGPAITITGDRKANGIGAMIGSIKLDCGWNSAGIEFAQLDNAVIGAIKVYRSRGVAVRVRSCRQSLFQSIQATEAIDGHSAIAIECMRESQGDSTNACRFDFVSAYACASRYLMSVRGNLVSGLGTCRNNQFGSVFLHATWERQLDLIPKEFRREFDTPNQALLLMNNCQDIGFDRITMTPAESTKCLVGDRVSRCVFAGRALVHSPSQFAELPGNEFRRMTVVERVKLSNIA